MVSKAAERSRRQRQDTFCEPIALIKMIVNVEQSSFSGVVLIVSRLVGIKEIIASKVFSKSRFNNMSHTRDRLEIGR